MRSRLAPAPELVAADQAWRAAQAAYRAARGTPEEGALYQQFRQLLNERNRVGLPLVLGSMAANVWALEAELREAQVELARRRSEPYLVRVEVGGAIVGSDAPERVRISPDLSGSGELFVQSAMRPPAVVFRATAWWGDNDASCKDIGGVLITFIPTNPMERWGVTLARFGYPNEEAFAKNDSLGVGFTGIGFYEMMNSAWPLEVVTFNRQNFPGTPEDTGLRHFMLACKENTLEVLCARFELERVEDSWEDEVARYLRDH